MGVLTGALVSPSVLVSSPMESESIILFLVANLLTAFHHRCYRTHCQLSLATLQLIGTLFVFATSR
jgi:hypothetical protein